MTYQNIHYADPKVNKTKKQTVVEIIVNRLYGRRFVIV